jgi:hypothetical protein
MADNGGRFGINKNEPISPSAATSQIVNPSLIATLEGDPDDLAAEVRPHAR